MGSWPEDSATRGVPRLGPPQRCSASVRQASTSDRTDSACSSSPGWSRPSCLLIEGNSSVVNGNAFQVHLKHASHTMGKATRLADGSITSSYDLSGWNMSTPFPFEHSITVP